MVDTQSYDHRGKQLEISVYRSDDPGVDNSPNDFRNISAPGLGEIQIEPVVVSNGEAAAGDTLTFSTHVTGKNVGYIFAEILMLCKDEPLLIGPVYRIYLDAPNNKEVNGVRYPEWGDRMEMKFTYRPSLRVLTDGELTGFGFLTPGGYGVPYEESIFNVDGLYRSVEGNEKHRARLTFNSNGELQRLLVTKKGGRLSRPRAISPKHGDRFTPFTQNLVIPDEEGDWQVETGVTNTLIFGKNSIRWMDEEALPGLYSGGILVQDLDGGLKRSYTNFTVTG
jgi:hypothetical protein